MTDNLAAIKLAYEDEALTVHQLCRRFEITTAVLYKLVHAGNWKMRRNNQRFVSRVEMPGSGGLLADLSHLARNQLRDLETAMALSGTDISFADRERNVRSLRNLLKVIEEIENLRQKKDSKNQHDTSLRLDATQRDELAKRIAALQESPG